MTSYPSSQVCALEENRETVDHPTKIKYFHYWSVLHRMVFITSMNCSCYASVYYLVYVYVWTDEVYVREGRTVLYTPLECLQFRPEEASRDKELVVRLESKSEELPFCWQFLFLWNWWLWNHNYLGICLSFFLNGIWRFSWPNTSHTFILHVFSCHDPLDRSDKGAAEWAKNAKEEQHLRPAAWDWTLEEPFWQVNGHQQAAGKARGQARSQHPAALQFCLCTALPKTGGGAEGKYIQSISS